jgi:hypothetical protein
MKKLLTSAMLIAATTLLGACTEETPTDIGGPLVPGGDVVTFEVILSPEQYLEFDTAFSGYVTPFETNIKLVARNFEGVLNANSLLRFTGLPTTLQVRDASGTLRTDSLPRFPTGYLMLRIDTTRSRGAGTLGAYSIAEAWDPSSVTWTVRIDTGSITRNWATPGGTKGPLIGSAAWQPGAADSVMIPLDSTQILALTNQTDSTRGALITLDQATGTNGAMLHVSAASIRVSAKSTIRPDTTIALTADLLTSAFNFTPEPPTITTASRVSGVPAWRGVLGVKVLRDMIVACPGTGCTVNLRDAHINLAELLLEPTPSPPGFSPEDSIRVLARPLLESANVPLSRSPVGDIPTATRIAIPRNQFLAGTTAPAVGLPITNGIASIVGDTATTAENAAPRRIALSSNPEAATFGFATFKSGPRLRLVLTISRVQ